MLDQKEIEQFKGILYSSKKEIEDQLKKFADKDDKVKGNFQTRYPNYGEEPQDSAEEVSDYDRALSIEHQLEEELVKVNKAIEKIETSGKYGTCELCGQEIDKGRLEVNPQALRCMKCADRS